MEETLQDIYNYKTGIHLTMFNQVFDGLYSIYLSLILLIVSAVLFRITRSFLFSASVGVVCFVVCWIPLNRYVLNDKRYIKYFKEFERKDEAWYKKWRRIAVILIVLQLPVMAIGALLAFMIVFAGLD
jgi:small-conductance mechanosensitive channel